MDSNSNSDLNTQNLTEMFNDIDKDRRIQEKYSFIRIILSVLMFMFGIWCIDIGVSGALAELNTGYEFKATNGWLERSPIQQYHIGLWICISAIFFLAVSATNDILNRYN